MEFVKKVNWQTHTDGKGYWTTFEKAVTVLRVELADSYENGEYGELRAYFDIRTWNCNESGLIYTDPRWIGEFRALMRSLGFTGRACEDITYSEQGMQGDNFVSMDVGEDFMREAEPMYRWLINKQPVSPQELV
jgi:hypothetical protein